MALQKTLSITIDTKLTGEEAYKQLKTFIDQDEVAINKFSTALYKNERGLDSYRHNFELTSTNAKKLQQEIDKLNSILFKKNVKPGSIFSDAFKEEQDKLNQRANLFKQQSIKQLQEVEKNLALEKSIRLNGINDIKTKQLQVATDEERIRNELVFKLLQLEENLRNGIIKSTQEAERTRLALIQQSARDITNVRKNLENAEKNLANRVVKGEDFRKETDRLIAELDRRLSLEQSIRIHGANSNKVIEQNAANAELEIRKRLTEKLQQLKENVEKGIFPRSAGGRLISNETARLNELANASQNLTNINKALALATDKTSESHRNLLVHIAEIIGIYRIYNAVINTTINSLRAIPNIGIQLESTRASLAATAGTSAGMEGILKALKEEAQRTGIELNTLRETFRNFQASTSLAGEKLETSWKIFTNLNTVITSLHLPTEKAAGIFNALAQIFNKSKVQSEELVKQLGNLIPGAFAAFAAANKDQFRNSAELIEEMKKGTVFAHETVEKFAEFLANRFSKSFEVAAIGLNSNIGRMKSSFTELGETIYTASSVYINQFVISLTSLANYIGQSITGVTGLTIAVKTLGYSIAVLIGASLFKSIDSFILKLAAAKVATNAWSLAIAGQAIPQVTRLLGVTELMTLALGKLKLAFAFLINPYTIVAGIGVLIYNFSNLQKEANNAAIEVGNSVDDFIKKYEELEKKKSESDPVKLATKIEINVDEDEAVKRVREELKKVDESIKDLSKGKFQFNLFDPFPGATQVKENNLRLRLLDEQIEKRKELLKIEEKEVNLAKERIKIEEEAQRNLINLTGESIQTLRKEQELNLLQHTNPVEFAKQNFLRQNATALSTATKDLEIFYKQIESIQGDIFSKQLEIQFLPKEKVDEAIIQLTSLQDRLKEAKTNFTDAEIVYDLIYKNADLAAQKAAETGKKSSKEVNNVYELSQKRLENSLKQQENLTNQLLDNITFKARQARLEIEGIVAKGLPGNNLKLVQIERKERLDGISERIKLLKEEQRLIRLSSEEQITYAKNISKSLDEAFNKLIKIESGGRKDAISPTGALGRAQIQPSTLKQYYPELVSDQLLQIEKKAKSLAGNNQKLLNVEKKILQDFAVQHQKEIENAAFVYFKSLVARYKGDIVKAVAAYNTGPGNVDAAIKEATKTKDNNFLSYLPTKPKAKEETTKHVEKFLSLTDNSLKQESNFLKNQEKILDNDREINKLTGELILLQQESGNKEEEILRTKSLALINIQNELSSLQGDNVGAESLQLQIEYLEKYNELASYTGKFDESLLKRWKDRKQLAIDLTEQSRKSALAERNYSFLQQEIQTKILAGYESEFSAINELVEGKSKYRQALQDELKFVQDKIDKGQVDLAIQERLLEIKERLAALSSPSNVARDINIQNAPGFVKTFAEEQVRLKEEYENEKKIINDKYKAQEISKEEHLKALSDLDSKYLGGSINSYLGYFQGILAMGAETFSTLTQLAIQQYGAQSKEAKKAFLFYKATKIAEIGVGTARAIIGVWESLGNIPIVGTALAIAATVAVGALGAAQIAAVAAQQLPAAHGGLTEVPAEQTYLLNKGERVLSPNQNNDLKRFMKEKTNSQEKQNNVIEFNPKMVTLFDRSELDAYLSSSSSERIIVNIMKQNG